MDYAKIAQEVVDNVGGKANIISVTHCVTRLRFRLKNSSIPDKAKVQGIDGVISVVEQGGQYQVVIGNLVTDVYDEVEKKIGKLDDAAVDEEKKSLFDRFTMMISGVFMPAIGPLAASGMLKGLLTILTIAGLLSETSGTYTVLYGIANAFFYFMPIVLGASAASYFKMNSYLGMLIGASMIYPTLMAFATNGEALNFLAIPINMMDYTSSVFPVIVAVWVGSLINKFIDHRMPASIKLFGTSLVILLITVPLCLIVIGPAITTVSQLLSQGVNFVYSLNPVLAGLVLGGPWILMVMFGLHWAFIPIFINNIASLGQDYLMGLLLANQFAMAGAAIAVGLKIHDKKMKSLSFTTGVTTLLGVSEPTLYGVLLPLKKPLIAAIIGGSAGAMVAGFFGTSQFSFGASGIFGIPLIINPAGIDAGFFAGVASQVIGFVVAFAFVYILGFSTESEKEMTEDAALSIGNEQIDLSATIKGQIVFLTDVPDKVFSEGLMGQGAAVIPSEGKVYAPFSGVVTAVFPTKHAIGLTSDSGAELLIHIGLDTVELEGKFFTMYAEPNQKINKGDLLLEFDLEAIQKAGYEVISPIIITNTSDYSHLKKENDLLVLEV